MQYTDTGAITTGDIILFSRTSLKQNWVRFFATSRWSHIGLAIRLDANNNVINEGGKLCLLETIGDDKEYDILTKTKRAGFRLCYFRDRIAKEYRHIAYRKLKRTARPDNMEARVTDFLHKYQAKPFFEHGNMSMIYLWLNMAIQDGGYSCTMIVGRFLQEVIDIPLSDYTITCSYDSYEPDYTGMCINAWYDKEVNLVIKYEEWHDTMGGLLAYLIVWLAFWFFTAVYVFGIN